MLLSVVLIAHVVLTTAGYAGLIATNIVLLFLCRDRDPQKLIDAFVNWRKAHRVFHPILGAGLLIGFALIFALHESWAAKWLLFSYGIVILGMIANTAVLVPWQRNAEQLLSESRAVTTGPVKVVLGIFSVAYIALLSLMILRPQ